MALSREHRTGNVDNEEVKYSSTCLVEADG
jgi:hypothetical protein